MVRIQIIDDDVWCGEAIIALLVSEAMDVRFQNTQNPVAEDGQDIYIVDNEFEDGDHGIDLVRRIRDRNPTATIILCSATNDRIDVTEAMNAGCNLMIEKGSAVGRSMLVNAVKTRIKTRATSASTPSFAAVLDDIKSIIAAWNTRMDQEATGV